MSGTGRGPFQLLDQAENVVPAGDGVVHDKAKARGVFEDDGLGDEVLEAGAAALENRHAGALLLGVAQDADKDPGAAEIAAKL